ncbi:hypothetical protein Y032_0108g74 [Ancylostoma ceylanicum]|nr:hypothetical protein Y032_0108g74 [Ancylostoma ceylanicum]
MKNFLCILLIILLTPSVEASRDDYDYENCGLPTAEYTKRQRERASENEQKQSRTTEEVREHENTDDDYEPDYKENNSQEDEKDENDPMRQKITKLTL